MPLNTQGKKQQFPEIMTAKVGAELATNLQGFLNCHPSMKTGVPVHRDFAVGLGTDFYACSRHIRYVRDRRLHLTNVLEGQG